MLTASRKRLCHQDIMTKNVSPSAKSGSLRKDLFVLLLFINVLSIAKKVDGYDRGNYSKFSSQLEDIIDKDLGVKEMQVYLDTLSFAFQALNGSFIINEIATKINVRVAESLKALNLLKTASEETIAGVLNNDSLLISRVCGEDAGEIQGRFVCFVGSSEKQRRNNMVPEGSITDAMKGNLHKVPYIKRQIIATEDGLLVMHPPSKNYSKFYMQFRKAYVSTVSPAGRDIVVVIDRSGSMAKVHGDRSLLQITIEAVTKLLDTLTENDRVGIVVFDTGTVIPGAATRKCVGTSLVTATRENIRFYQNIIQQIQTGARCNYELALRDAFKFFKNTNPTNNSEKQERVLLFLSDGPPTLGEDPVKVIADENKDLQNTVTVFTYAIGQAWNSNTLSVLSDMAKQTVSDPKYGKIREGVFKHIADPLQLDSAVTLFYAKFLKRHNELVMFPYGEYDTLRESSVPYIYLCKQIHKSDTTVFGATCLEMPLPNLLGKQTFYEHARHTYSFVIDGTGNTILHPNLPESSAVYDIPIETFERGTHLSPVLESMKRGNSGHWETTTKRTEDDDSDPDGTIARETLLAYHWKPILHTNFSVCVVVVGVDGELSYDVTSHSTRTTHYHGGGVTTRPETACNHFNRYANKASTAVSYIPGAFMDPCVYSNSGEKDYLAKHNTDQPPCNSELRTSVLESLYITRYLEELWIGLDNHSSHAIWRYIGTTDGVFRIYPGIQVPENYDHRKMPWFRRSIAVPGEIVLTGPYVDQWGGGHVITLSKAIVQTISKNKTLVFGVMAIDISMTHFYQQLIDAYPVCLLAPTRCFVMDNRGSIIIHNDFVNVSNKTPTVEGIHVTQKSPAISKDLLKRGIMSKRFCLNIMEKKKRQFYQVSSQNLKRGIDFLDSHYQLLPVLRSNIFVVVEDQHYFSYQDPCCKNMSAVSDMEVQCDKSDCPCVCWEDVSSNSCASQSYLISHSDMPVCLDRKPRHKIELPQENDKLINLPACFNPKCHQKSRRECYKAAGCSWCSLSQDFTPLSQSHCTVWEKCYFGIQGNLPPRPKTKVCSKGSVGNQYGLSLFLLGGLVCGITSLTISIVCVRLLLNRRRNKENSKQIPANLPVRTDSLLPAENGYVVARVYPETRQSTFLSCTQFGDVVYHHNFVFKNSP